MSRIVLITGATAGIGAACARAFARTGAHLVLCARRTERLEALAATLPVPVFTLTLDVRDRASIEAQLAALPKPFDEVDVLVNNAGLALGLEPAQNATLDDWDTMIDTNVRGLVHVTRALLPGMVQRQRGHVINVGSVAGSYPYPGGNVYGATKAFVQQFSLNLRADLHGTKVRVTNVEPGMVETDFSKVRFKGDETRADGVYRGADPLTAEDIADVVRYVADLPARINVNRIEVMPTTQAFAGFTFDRK